MTIKTSIALVAGTVAAFAATAQVRVDAGGTSVMIGGGNVDVRAGDSTSVTTKGGSVDVRTGDSTVSTKGGDVSVGKGNVASSRIGSVAAGTRSQGVAVVNGQVHIDGQEIPPGVTRYKSPKTGVVYNIRREGGSVEVTSE